MKRKDAKLDAERGKDQHRAENHRLWFQERDPLSDARHVQPSGLVIERGNAHQEERRPEQIDDCKDAG
jgi:hypothetical protein